MAENGNATVLASRMKKPWKYRNSSMISSNNTGINLMLSLSLQVKSHSQLHIRINCCLQSFTTVEVRSIDHNAGTDPGLKQLINFITKNCFAFNSTTGFMQL
ncbi:MAG: hypothetical protein IPH57_00135 [Saprospiraceae bacterium]|nr:hypothetical protein [Saprospiraceae bacterium]